MLVAAVNLSEGRLEEATRIGTSAGAGLLDIHADIHHNRSVLTLGAEDTESIARVMVAEAVERLDLRAHRGAHPRMGVVDVVPFTPFSESSMVEATDARDRFAHWAADELGMPVFIYGTDRSLPSIRRDAFVRMSPDYGPPQPHPTAGAMCVGSRRPMLAWNLWLGVRDLPLARAISAELRRIPGVRSLAFDLDGRTQVSCNLISPLETPPQVVYDAVAERAPVAGCELVGLLPDAVLRQVPETRWAQLDLSVEQTVEWRLRSRSAAGESTGPA